MTARNLGVWNINVNAAATGRYWLNPDGSGGIYQASKPNPFNLGGFSALKLAWISSAIKIGGAINLSILDVDEQSNILESFSLGAPTDIGLAVQNGYLIVGPGVPSFSAGSIIQGWQRNLIFAAVAVDVVSAPVTWQGRFELWGLT